MNGSAKPVSPPDVSPEPRRFLTERTACITLAVVLLGAWIAATALSRSELIGRLLDPMTHSDVNYLIDGIRRLVYIEVNGVWAEYHHLLLEPLHAPFSAYQAALGFYVFGFHDWAPYLSSILLVWVFLGACAWLLRGHRTLVIIAALLVIAGMPLASTTISEFSPELPLGLFTALGVLATLPIPMLAPISRRRVLAGLCFGIGCLAKPSAFVFVPMIVCATLGIVFARDIILTRRWREWWRGIGYGSLQLLLSLWLPALYIVPNFTKFKEYFKLALFNKENLKAFGYILDMRSNIEYYLTGSAGEYMFGNFLWVYIGLIAGGIAAAAWRADQRYIRRLAELLFMVFLMWLLPTVSLAKNTLFGAPFSYLIAFMVVMALGSIAQTLRGGMGTVAVSALGLLLLLFGTSRTLVPNTPGLDWQVAGAHIIREKWPQAQDRLRAVLLGNAPNYFGRYVYLTNGGYYHSPTLWYWFLKKDPFLDWNFGSQWQDPDPQHHRAWIEDHKADFIIAGQEGNGLTYRPTLIAGATAAENPLLAMLWNDQNFMPIDRFYGLNGRSITVFQRRGAFAGWRPIGGITQTGDVTQPWISSDTTSHLQAYAADPIAGELTFDATGPAHQSIEIEVNWRRLGQATFDANGRTALAVPFDLARGDNDIVFRYSSDAPVQFTRLLVTREFAPGD
jgi:MFS family permease